MFHKSVLACISKLYSAGCCASDTQMSVHYSTSPGFHREMKHWEERTVPLRLLSIQHFCSQVHLNRAIQVMHVLVSLMSRFELLQAFTK